MNAPIFPTRQYHTDGTVPGLDRIFVFGSNCAGRHGNGAALLAAKCFGAAEGIGRGRTGYAYAIATRTQTSINNKWIVSRKIGAIEEDITLFVAYTKRHDDLEYFVTAVGCGHAGFEAAQIAPLFREAVNCSFPIEWKPYLDEADHSVFENNKKSM